MEEVVLLAAISFDIEQPTWKMMRKFTSLTIKVSGHNLIIEKLKSHISQIRLALDTPLLSAADFWDEITKNPGKTCTRWLELYVE